MKRFGQNKTPVDKDKKRAPSAKRGFIGRTAERIGILKKKKDPLEELNSDDGANATEDKTHQTKVPNAAERAMLVFLEKTASAGLKKIKSEWLEVACHMPQDVRALLFDFNMAKNFPGGSPCLDATRVGLTFNVPPESDYIHANWIQTKLCNLGCRLILTQAPQDNTINDFWRLLWQEKVRTVVHLCEKYEQNRRVCSQYWPLVVGSVKMYGVLRVQYVGNVTCNNESAYQKLQMSVSFKSEKAHDCFIYVCKTWPEGGAPESILSLLRTIRAVVDDGQTVVVHGAAGVGRPSVFASIMIGQRMLLEGRHVNVLSIAQELRENRMGAITTELQYITIYRAICEYIRAKGVNVPLCKQLIGHLDAYKKEYIAAGNQPVDVKSGSFEVSKDVSKDGGAAPTLKTNRVSGDMLRNTMAPTQLMSRQPTNFSSPPVSQPAVPMGLFGASSPMPKDLHEPVFESPKPLAQTSPAQLTPTQPAQSENKADDNNYVILNNVHASDLPPPPKRK